ncbi:histidine phosphatase family protein [Bacterioplanoides sp.]|uniref:histidine phosphatase family protein n=1 Tax=Bacterioplanoides sp. TaxID=2066072 RepID=UPI003AFF7D50
MASIYLVRHGQASFGKLNYDQLSELGWQQSELVGQALLARGITPACVVHGAMVRHEETLKGAQKHWHSAASVVEMPGFNEFDSDDVVACAFPEFQDKANFGRWLQQQDNRRKAFQQVFAQAIERWISGQHQDYQESWQSFTTRCNQALDDLIQQLEGQDAVVFTSGGPITAIAQHCLALNNAKAFELNWTLLNAGISQILYSRSGKKSLASCNEHHHLAAAGSSFVTYR